MTTVFIMGFIIFCCGVLYRFLILAEREKKKNNDNDTKIVNKETETRTGWIE